VTQSPVDRITKLDSNAFTQMDDIECEICCNIYNSENRRPKNLPCGHIFCQACMAKEFAIGKSTCPTCRSPHNAQRVEDLPICILVERLIGRGKKTLNEGVKSCDSESDDEEDDYNEGPCSTHKKSVVYFYCNTHCVKICWECTVIDHQVNKCKIISFKDKLENRKDDNILKANSIVTAITETLSVFDEVVKEKDEIISNQELKIKELENSIELASKAIEDARRTITNEKIASEKVKHSISQGKIRKKDIESESHKLQNANTKKTITKYNNDIETATVNVSKWIKDVSTEFKLLNKVSEEPSNILKALKNGKVIFSETAVKGRKSFAKLTSMDEKLHLHTFNIMKPQEGATILQYEKVVSHLRTKPPTLLFLDLKYNGFNQGRIYIRIRPELHAFVKHIPDLFTAAVNGDSVLGEKGYMCRTDALVLKINKTVPDIASHKNESVIVKSGDVFCDLSGNSIQLLCTHIVKERKYKSNHAIIGGIESGMEVAKACHEKGYNNQNKILITDCGLVLDK
ncbi:unnamed protein product, partial [Meganyctiphanes norvegica]